MRDVARPSARPWGDLMRGEEPLYRRWRGAKFSRDLPGGAVIVDVSPPQPLSVDDHSGAASWFRNCDSDLTHPARD